MTSSPPFTTDLFIPSYPDGEFGEWRFQTILMMGDRSYFGPHVYGPRHTTILTGPSHRGTQSWMSTTAVELESQEIGLRAARGNVVILGMGMGWVTVNSALMDAVTSVTVVDRDPDIIALIQASGIFEQLPTAAREKITVVEADALEWTPDRPVDVLQADIWLSLIEEQKFDEARQMQANIKAERMYVWGQELEIWRLCRRRVSGGGVVDRAVVEQVVEEDIRLPLILPDWDDFGAKLGGIAQHWAQTAPEWWNESVASP